MKKTRIRLSLFSLVLALVLFGLTICATGREPFSVYWSILAGSFGSTKSFLNVLAYTLPLIMTGLGAAVAFQSGVFNIGGEGQVLVGGLAAVIVGLTIPLPAPWGWLLALLAGFAAGALWAVLPTLFAGRNLTSLSVATIMMNSIAALLTEYIVKSFFQRPDASNTETVVVNEGSILPRFSPAPSSTTASSWRCSAWQPSRGCSIKRPLAFPCGPWARTPVPCSRQVCPSTGGRWRPCASAAVCLLWAAPFSVWRCTSALSWASHRDTAGTASPWPHWP